MVGYVGSWKKGVAAVDEDFWRMNFQRSRLLLLYDFNRFIPALSGQHFVLWSKLQRLLYMGCVSFFRDLVLVLTLFCFSIFFAVYFLQTTCRPIRGLCSNWVISSDTLSGDANPRDKFSQTVCHHKKGTCSTWDVLTYKPFHPFN